MKKRRWLTLLSLSLIIFGIFLISAQINNSEQEKVNKAYSCLQNKTSNGKCSTISLDEKIFSALAIGQCRAELASSASSEGCWPSTSCNVKTTAQALLASGQGNAKTQNWLLSKTGVPTELTWYLQIETFDPSSCTISYKNASYRVNIDEDKKISSGAGSCLTLAQDNYWLRVSPSCYNTDIKVSCNQNFLTSLIFKKSTSETVHIMETTSSSSGNGTTTEKVISSCFKTGSSCDYEASLWASLVLDYNDVDVSPYLPYLITMAEDNQRYLPDAFLYALTADSEYEISLLSKQKSSKWWVESGDKFYDTALALYPLQQENPQEKINAKEWLLDSQDTNGCWDGNIKNTGFILASIWPQGQGGGTGGTGNDQTDCLEQGYSCATSALACEGELVPDFVCSGTQRCCTTPESEETCAEVGGIICPSSQSCIGGSFWGSSDSQSCCVDDGYCGVQTDNGNSEDFDCELNDGSCRESCSSGEVESFDYLCPISSDLCCVDRAINNDSPKKSYLWVWILLILIILVTIAIIFRDRLRMFWSKMNFKGSGKPSPPSNSYYPPARPMQRMPERRIITSQHPQRPVVRRPSHSQNELDEVLRKLKEMGK